MRVKAESHSYANANIHLKHMRRTKNKNNLFPHQNHDVDVCVTFNLRKNI